MDYLTLHDELINDPLARGYATMTDEEAAADLNTAYRTYVRDSIAGSEVYERVVVSEFLALTDAEKAEVWNIVHLGDEISVGPNSKARTRFIALFGSGSETIAALADYLTVPISRATELGLLLVRESDVFKARSM